MCLWTKNAVKKIADKDIVCYKVICKVGNDYLTIYQRTPIELGKTYTDNELIHMGKGNDVYYIGQGVYHTFKKYKDAVVFLREHFLFTNRVIVRCVIPKGTEYYEGTFDDEEESYGSKTLYLSKKILKEEKPLATFPWG